VLLTGRDVGAEEALRIGWLDGLLPREVLVDEVRTVAHHVASMPAASVAAVKRVVDTTFRSFEDALVAETDAFGALTAAGAHVDPMRRFLGAGGQTRDGETGRWDAIMRATRAEPTG
jgi:enoyl-CoA hydratase/carnithine racemase